LEAALVSIWARPKTPAVRSADFARNLVSAVESGLQHRPAASGTVTYFISREPDSAYYQIRLSLPDHREVRIMLLENPAKPAGEGVRMLDIQEAIVK
jgi:hypothetical protein